MIRIGVISDVHSHEKNDDKPQGGYYFPSMHDEPAEKNPFAALKKLIRENQLELDYILSPGDYAHQIDKKGLKSVWEQLKVIHHQAKSKQLIGTIGNHDVASRELGEDSYKHIKEFDTCFPLYPSDPSGDDSLRNDLLEKSYCVFEDQENSMFFIILNSCFDHWNEINASKGKIRTSKVDEIQEAIKKSSCKKKILLIHHNPIVHEAWVNDNDYLEGSQKLLEKVDGIDLIIYGHKHNFRFEQRRVYPKNINLLAAGSFACFKTSLARNEQNTFHIIEFDDKQIENCFNQGLIKTYEFNPMDGWSYSNKLLEGFGCYLENQKIEEEIENFIKSETSKYLEWSDILVKLPFLSYISVKKRNYVLNHLKEKEVIKKMQYTSKLELDSLILK